MNWSEINLNNWVLWLGLGIVALAILIWIYIRLHEKLPYELNETILTERERAFYRILKPIADKLELQICPKVRVVDKEGHEGLAEVVQQDTLEARGLPAVRLRHEHRADDRA